MKRKNKPSIRLMLTVLFVVVVFFIIIVTMAVLGGLIYIFVHLGLFNADQTHNRFFPLLLLILSSTIIGTVVAAVVSKIPLRPINKLIDGMNALATGDYSKRITLGRLSLGREISDSFNTLAEELCNTELLRSDFINNFSHEFKTPIVSIRGFAKLLQKGNLPPEQQQEYLGIIVNETTRLSDLATNVLNLTKIENQSILTELTSFNLSEQLRRCLLLLEKKWSDKSLLLTVDLDEQSITANEELLQQVWINLLDNAVKFTPQHGEISLGIVAEQGGVTVWIANDGDEIGQEEQKRIFRKFYQGDSSHTGEGTGIGLAVVQRIVELHHGSIVVTSMGGKNTFAVTLPA